LAIFTLETINLPRQARDRPRKSRAKNALCGRWEHGEHGSISSDSIEDLGVTVLIDTEYSASAGWRLPMSVIAPRSVRSDEKLQANTTLAISAAKDIDITISFFAPAASAAAPIRYNISVAMPTGVEKTAVSFPLHISPVISY
jgi:hypothetical protein